MRGVPIQAGASSDKVSWQHPIQNEATQTHTLQGNLQAFGSGKAPMWHYGLLALGGLGVLFPQQSMALMTFLPRALMNLPKAFQKSKQGLLLFRPKAIFPYQSAVTESATTVLSPIDMRYKNMAFRDWASRFSILGVYITQGILAIQYRRRPVETWVRNFGAWYLTIQVMMYTKDPNSLYSWLMNQFMVPSKAANKLSNPSLLQALASPKKHLRNYLDSAINPSRAKWNYLNWLQKAGIRLKSIGVTEPMKTAVYKSAYWNTLDINELRLVDNLKNKLMRRGLSSKQLQYVKQAKQIEQFIGQITKMRLASVGVNALATTLLVGIFVPYAAIKLAAPIDKLFERPQRRFYIDPNTGLEKDPTRQKGGQ